VSAGDERPVRRIAIPAEHVYLTFDDGPDDEWTPRILDVLAAYDAKATFFAIGRHAERSAALLRRARQAGHAIGNHGYGHEHPWIVSDARARAEVRQGGDAIAQATGAVPRAYRPAFGRRRAAMFDEARRCGQRVVLWRLSVMDWGPFARAPRIARRVERAQGGDIVLLHDGRNRRNHPEVVTELLPELLHALRRRGLVAATLPIA
jgi:peptidoglycan/xylan/chitin deacetylase (PgdA/CDA1 family)